MYDKPFAVDGLFLYDPSRLRRTEKSLLRHGLRRSFHGRVKRRDHAAHFRSQVSATLVVAPPGGIEEINSAGPFEP
jgi:hypothetical protein